MTIPTTSWQIGQEYCVVQTVTHKNALGVPDPSITERMCLPHEAPSVIEATMKRNPYATSYVSLRRVWRGPYGA